MTIINYDPGYNSLKKISELTNMFGNLKENNENIEKEYLKLFVDIKKKKIKN